MAAARLFDEVNIRSDAEQTMGDDGKDRNSCAQRPVDPPLLDSAKSKQMNHEKLKKKKAKRGEKI